MNLQLRNPHSVLAALARRPQDVLEVSVLGSRLSPAWDDVLAQAEDARIPIVRRAESRQHKQRRKNKANEQGGRTGAAEATVKPSPEVELEALWRPAGEDDTATGLWLALDCLQDPHNVGAIFRTAAFFASKGIGPLERPFGSVEWDGLRCVFWRNGVGPVLCATKPDAGRCSRRRRTICGCWARPNMPSAILPKSRLIAAGCWCWVTKKKACAV